jgi:hypothetical protein
MSNILNRSLNSPSIKRKNELPFYEAPSGITTPSQIIKETKEKLLDSSQQNGKIRSLQTNRPFTPKEDTRTLFGSKSIRPINERPPSAISINAKSFETPETSRPLSNTRLTPIFDSKPHQKIQSQASINSSEPPIPPQLLRQSSKTRLLPQLLHISKDDELKRPSMNSVDDQKVPEYERKASGGSNRGGLVDCEDEKCWRLVLKPHLDQMINFHQDKKTEQLMVFCDEFYVLLEAKSQLGKNSSYRSTILKTIFKFLDTECDHLKLRIARIILAVS